jgi:hypothetical protein
MIKRTLNAEVVSSSLTLATSQLDWFFSTLIIRTLPLLPMGRWYVE